MKLNSSKKRVGTLKSIKDSPLKGKGKSAVLQKINIIKGSSDIIIKIDPITMTTVVGSKSK